MIYVPLKYLEKAFDEIHDAMTTAETLPKGTKVITKDDLVRIFKEIQNDKRRCNRDFKSI